MKRFFGVEPLYIKITKKDSLEFELCERCGSCAYKGDICYCVLVQELRRKYEKYGYSRDLPFKVWIDRKILLNKIQIK